MQAKHLLPFCCNRDSPKFDMQHDHVLKKWIFALLTPSEGPGEWGSASKIFAICYHVAVFRDSI